MAQRRSRPRGEARRELILDVALKSFAENGFRGSSIAEIAELCGLSQPGLLHYFPSKAALLAAVLEYRDRLDAERLEFGAPLSGPDALRRLARLVEHNTHVPGLVQLFTVVTGESVTDDHPAHAWAADRYRRLESGLARALDAGIAEGTVRADIDTKAVARQVFAMMDGLQQQWLLDPDAVDMGALFGDYIEQVIAHIAG
ncbi:TetR family transcriptional regulator [Nocardia otitidiscaviarum]|uniref:TetR family transcriptional regulator n=1 Tax=Nocardia otitidiscaviarum TaxID=1823 RepID=A0A516NJC9_9NOCA|nr:TetR/AcrR family transcriptional regulator [Nocardia otitidiscaviarum]MCP9619541.1 TetR/AcrR family transcriptional regulator [Nocardia otitidiscaviarum]QDP79002.1 TetR family transcriptional regulator [Nocardia otitidiscaviarum]